MKPTMALIPGGKAPGHPRARRARRTLLLALGLVVLSQLAAGAVIDYRYPLLKFPSLRFVFSNLPYRKACPEVLFLGSSRFGGDFNEREISSLVEQDCRLGHSAQVYNASVPGGDHASQLFVLEQLLAAGVRPRLVVLEVSPDLVNWYNPFAEMTVIRQHRWEHLPDHLLPAVRSSQTWRLLTTRLVPLYQHRAELWKVARAILEHGKVTEHYAAPVLTFGPAPARKVFQGDVRWDDLLAVKPRRQPAEVTALIEQGADLIARWLRDYHVCDGSRRALRDTLRRCRDEGIEALLVSPPVTALHRARHTPVIEAKFKALLAEMKGEFGCGYVDGRAWVPDTLFVDTHHVGEEGGILFSRLFVRRVLAPWWRQEGLVQR